VAVAVAVAVALWCGFGSFVLATFWLFCCLAGNILAVLLPAQFPASLS
jgi:hypothetical protein